MLPYVEIIDVQIGPWVIRAWGIFVSAAFAVGLWLAVREAKRRRLAADPLIDLAIWIIVAAMIGGRAFYVLNQWAVFRWDVLAWFRIWDGGLAMYGGLLGGAAAVWLYCRRRRLAGAYYYDVLAYVLPLAIAVGRLGCFFIHDHLGRPTPLFLGIRLTDGTVRHDLALYEILFSAVLFAFFVWWRRKSLPPGLMTAVFFAAYGGFRFAFDFLRATDVPMADPIIRPGLHPSQYAAGLSLLLAIVWLMVNKAKKTVQAK